MTMLTFLSDSSVLNNAHREKLSFIQLAKEFIEIEAWLLLAFFLCLDNQLSSLHFIVTYWRVQMFEQGDSSNR